MSTSIIPPRTHNDIIVDCANVRISLLSANLDYKDIYNKSFYLEQDWVGDEFVDDVYETVFSMIQDMFGHTAKEDLNAFMIEEFGEDSSGNKTVARESFFLHKGFRFNVWIAFGYKRLTKNEES